MAYSPSYHSLLEEKQHIHPFNEDDDIKCSDSTSQDLTPSCTLPFNTRLKWKARTLLPYLLHALLLSTSLSLFLLSPKPKDTCLRDHKSYSPASPALTYLPHPQRLNGSFTFPSPYRGPPSPKIDAAWAAITDIGAMRISAAELEMLDPTWKEEAVRYPEEMGGGWMGSLEVFHQLHCVNLLRQYTYPEYYKTRVVSWEDPPDILRTHVDHCLELLRQKVMCDIDVGAMTYNWVHVRDAPWPNFNTWHRCMDFEKVLEWGKAHQVRSGGVKMTRTEGVVVLATPP